MKKLLRELLLVGCGVLAGLPVCAQKQALFVSGATPTTSDLQITNYLAGFGFVVTHVTGPASQTSQATGKDLVVVSSSVSSGDVAAKFREVAVPVLEWEYGIQDEMDFTPDNTASHNVTASQTTITIVNPDHPMAAGLPAGDVVVYSTPSSVDWGANYASSAIVIATPQGQPSQACLYGFEAGATLLSGSRTAAARRVFF